MRINIGCGQTPTPGFRNFDNSPSLRLARLPLVPEFLHKIGFLKGPQYGFISFARGSGIAYADALRRIPLPSASCELVYSSHMLEHLDREGADRFLAEAFRVLRPGGVIRLVVPDIRKQVDAYLSSGDADAFVEATYLALPRSMSLSGRLISAFIGARNHRWMYDGESLSRLLTKHGFRDPCVLAPGATRIPDPGELDLSERSSESVYVEAVKSEG